jgi:hypothetical protein
MNQKDIQGFAEKYVKLLNEGEAKKKKVTEKDVDPEELRMGIEIEKEHTNDPVLAKKIALDHLAEFPKYYTALKAMEKKMKLEKTARFNQIALAAFRNELEKIAAGKGFTKSAGPRDWIGSIRNTAENVKRTIGSVKKSTGMNYSSGTLTKKFDIPTRKGSFNLGFNPGQKKFSVGAKFNI